MSVARPIRTRRLRTLRPSSGWFSRATMVSASRRSWWARAGLEVVISKVPERSSTSSHSLATSGPIRTRKAAATWVPSKRAPPGCLRRILGRILPNLSTGLDPACADGPDHRSVNQIGRKWARFDRRHDHLAARSHLVKQGGPPFAVKLRKDVVQQEHRPFTSALADQRRFGQLQADDSGP